MAKAKTQQRKAAPATVHDDDIADWEAASAALYEACLPPSPDATVRDIYGNPARVTYDDFMQRTLRLERATFKLANKARADGHPHGALEHLRVVRLGVLRRSPFTNDGERIDIVDLGEVAPSKVPDQFNLADDIVAAGVEVFEIKEHRETERAYCPVRDRGDAEDDDANDDGPPDGFEFVKDSTCLAIVKALWNEPAGLRPGHRMDRGLEAKCGGSQVAGTLKTRLRWMKAAGLTDQAGERWPWLLTDKARKLFAPHLGTG